MAREPKKLKSEKKVTRYTYDEIKEPRTPETGHTSLLPTEELVVTCRWTTVEQSDRGGEAAEGDQRPVVVDMDPAATRCSSGGQAQPARSAVLPLQRNEIVSESRIAQIIERARRAAEEKSGAARRGTLRRSREDSARERRAKRVEFYTHEQGGRTSSFAATRYK